MYSGSTACNAVIYVYLFSKKLVLTRIRQNWYVRETTGPEAFDLN